MRCLLSIHQVIVFSIFHSDYKTNEHELHFNVIILIIHHLYTTILSYRCFIGVNPERSKQPVLHKKTPAVNAKVLKIINLLADFEWNELDR